MREYSKQNTYEIQYLRDILTHFANCRNEFSDQNTVDYMSTIANISAYNEFIVRPLLSEVPYIVSPRNLRNLLAGN